MRVGRWELVKLLGRGGMGEVWLGRDAERGEEVAIKRLLSAAPDSDGLLRFQREAQALLRLRDPAVVAWRGAGQDEAGRPWVAMELVRGGTLEDLVIRAGPLPPRRAVELARDLCGGLAAVHASGVLHRDLKPANVLLDEGQRPKLTDFGLTRPIARGGSQTETGAIMGSPGYMPPEQVTGSKEDLGPATDVYGLGAVLFFLLTGQAPFRGESVLRCLESILRDPPPAPSQRRPGVPAALDAIVLRCLSRSPAGRYPSARALQGALQGWLEVERRGGRADRAARAWILPAALGALAGTVALVVGLSRYRVPAPAPTPVEEPAAVAEARRALARQFLASARTRGRTGNRQGERADFDQAIALDPWNAQARRDRAFLLSQLGDLPGARADYDQAIALDPGHVTTYCNRAAVREAQGDLKGAIADFGQAIALNPGSTPAYLGRARARTRQGDRPGARADCDRVIELDPQDVQAYRDRAALRKQQGDLGGALADYGRALDLDPWRARVPEEDPWYAGAFRDRALSREGQGDLKGAVADAERFLQLAPDHAQAPAVRTSLERLRAQLAGSQR